MEKPLPPVDGRQVAAGIRCQSQHYPNRFLWRNVRRRPAWVLLWCFHRCVLPGVRINSSAAVMNLARANGLVEIGVLMIEAAENGGVDFGGRVPALLPGILKPLNLRLDAGRNLPRIDLPRWREWWGP